MPKVSVCRAGWFQYAQNASICEGNSCAESIILGSTAQRSPRLDTFVFMYCSHSDR